MTLPSYTTMTPYAQHLLFHYLANVASRFPRSSKIAQELYDWVTDHADLLGFEDKNRSAREKPSRQEWKDIITALRDKRSTTQDAPEDPIAHNLRTLGTTMGLSETDMAILNLLLRCRTQPELESMVNQFGSAGDFSRAHCLCLTSAFLPCLLGISINTVRNRLMPAAPLVQSGLIAIDDEGDISMNHRLCRLTHLPDETSQPVLNLLLDTAAPSELEWSDFDHLAHHRDHIERLLKGTLQTGAAGINILLYGPPGTGKTEFCKVLADRLGVSLYGVGEADEHGREMKRHERLSELKLAQALVGRDRQSLLLFDEMDDLLSPSGSIMALFGLLSADARQSVGSKVFMNRLLEQSPTPVLWTTNTTSHIDPAILRRMTFTLELRKPTPKVRARIWARQLTRHGIKASADDARALAMEFDTTPGVAAGATFAAQLIGGDLATVRHGVRNLARVLSCRTLSQRTPERFDPAFLQTDEDMIRLADRLVTNGERRFSLCLQGPPGTGKSAFVRYLAERMELEVMQKRTSDLLSCWVGGTEKHIADAFAEAHDTESFLVFDEADSLLADRGHAERSWEVSQVNEMLTWMESHPWPFACTTNHRDGLDPASLRRFVFKIAFDYLTPDQATAMFRAYFEVAPPKTLEECTVLTPGDFAVVRRKAEVLRLLRDAPALADMLRAECDAKPGRTRPIRFRP